MASALGAPGALAQNLLTNPGFETDLSGWTSSGTGGGAAHDAAVGNPSPGSARIVVIWVDRYIYRQLEQCVAIAAPATVDVLARAKRNDIGASLEIVRLFSFDGTACDGAQLDDVVTDRFFFHPDGWLERGRFDYALPAGTQSVKVVLFADADGPGFGSDVHYDHVRFGPAGTAPVTLERFAVE